MLEESLAYAEHLVTATSPSAMRETIRMLRAPLLDRLDEHLQKEAEAQARCFASKDYSVALEAVKNKKLPVFDWKEVIFSLFDAYFKLLGTWIMCSGELFIVQFEDV